MTALFPPRESLVLTSRLGTGNSRTFFYDVLFINRNMFYIFFILILNFLKNLIFLLPNTENLANPLILQRKACMESFFLFAGALLFDEIIRQSAAQAGFRTVWETPNLPINIQFRVQTFFGDQFVEKVDSFTKYKRASKK